MASAQIVLLANGGILIAARWHVELAFGIHAPETVETSLVEVDEARRYLNAIVELVLAAELVIEVFAVTADVLLEPSDEGFGIALDDLVGVDEIEVDIP